MQFTSVIRGHHIYKSVWTPTLGEKLNCREDDRKEAKQHEEYAIGTYLESNTGSELAGHVPIELSYLIYTFLRAYNDNEVSAKVTGSKRLENGLVVPGTFKARTNTDKYGTYVYTPIQRQEFKEGNLHRTISAHIITQINNMIVFLMLFYFKLSHFSVRKKKHL